MQSAERKDFRKPDEVRQFPMGRLELINVGGAMVGRAVFEPGWRWSTSVQPLVKTKSCEAPHFQYHVSGELGILVGQRDQPLKLLSGQRLNFLRGGGGKVHCLTVLASRNAFSSRQELPLSSLT